ncbi:hypothetical protein [uncultured Jatrophihabitans sp.]|uniref:hypothetical protein n=1 Tax=uncultured Jatrophihabitans sp. TaxID=1610747 RepID=UPI0035CBC20B
MTASSPIRHPVQALVTRREDLAELRAESRMSAYVYGDVLVLAATAGVSDGAVRSGEALLVVLGAVLSTYVAHVLADVVGAVFAGRASAAALLAEARDSVPVLSAGLPSFALLGTAARGWPTPVWAEALACGILILRIAAIGLVYRRLRRGTTVQSALWFGVLIALVAAIAVALKFFLTH